jgi:hypothetical protein
MRNVTDIAGVKPQITGTLYLQNGSSVSLNNSDFKANTFAIQSGTSNSNEFTVGACVIGALNFTLMNDTGKFSGIDWYDSRVAITLDFGSNKTITYEYYWVVKHHEIGQLITVECYDALKILDEYNLYELTQNYGITFPCYVSDILNALSREHGFTFSGCSGTNIQLEDPKNEQMTQRALLSYIAQLCGQYVKAYGIELRFGWYNLSSTTHVGTSFSHDLRTSNITITGVKVSSYDDSATAEEPSGGSASPIEIEDNPFITANNVASVASTIYSAIGSGTFSYRPGDVDILSNAAIEAGDALLVDTGEEQNVLVLATNITYKPQLRESIDSDAEPYAGDLRIDRSAYIKKQAQRAISDDLADSNSDLSKAIAGAGGKTRVINIRQRGQAGTLATSDTFTGFVMSSSGISALNISSWTTEALKCYIMPQALEVPSFDSITALLEATGDVVDNYPFKLRLKVKVNSYVGYIDVQAFYTTAGQGKVICIAIPSGTGTSGADQHGGTTVFTMARPSTGELTFVPFKMFGRTDQGYAFLYGVTDREWNVYQNAPSA